MMKRTTEDIVEYAMEKCVCKNNNDETEMKNTAAASKYFSKGGPCVALRFSPVMNHHPLHQNQQQQQHAFHRS